MSSLVRYHHGGRVRPGVLVDGQVFDLAGVDRLADLLTLRLTDIRDAVETATTRAGIGLESCRLLAPIDGPTPMWASGVTYEVSRDARMEESRDESVYDRVYDAERPELFFKAVAEHVVTTGDPIGRRSDSTNDTPEPELALVVNAGAEIVAFGVANDMSSRSIEGENPLYLPQAKTYAASAGLGPELRVVWEVDDPDELTIELTVERGDEVAFAGSTSTARLHRSFDELVGFLTRAQVFPHGVVLATGTCVVPPLDDPVVDGDLITITVPGVGRLVNRVCATDELLGWFRVRTVDPTAEFPW